MAETNKNGSEQKYGTKFDFRPEPYNPNNDPLERARMNGGNVKDVFEEAHLDNATLAYESRLGKQARGIMKTRNVDGQGLPDKPQPDLIKKGS